MRKIYFIKHEVKINESFLYKDIRLTITDELIQDNPHLFTVEGSAAQENEEEISIFLEDNSWREKSISSFDVSTRVISCLTSAGIKTLEDLTKKSRVQIRSINNVGKLTYQDIINLMNREIPKRYHK